MSEAPSKSVTLAVVFTNAWAWKGKRQVQRINVPLANGKLGSTQAYTFSWGCFGLTVTLSTVAPLPQIQVVQTPASGLVDLRGQQLGGPRP